MQARSHYQALALVRSFAEVRIWSPTLLHAQRFADDIGAMATTAERAVEGADVVVTATNAQAPILRGSWLKRGCHVNAIGAPRPAPPAPDRGGATPAVQARPRHRIRVRWPPSACR